MLELIPNDPVTSSSVTEGTIRWAPNDAFSQAFGNKPEYASRVRQVGPNILPVRGSIHTYYTLSQSRSWNTNDSTVSYMAEDKKTWSGDGTTTITYWRTNNSNGNKEIWKWSPLSEAWSLVIAWEFLLIWLNVGLTQKEVMLNLCCFCFSFC